MGGCASKPRGMGLHPTEVPATPTNKPQPEAAETISQGNNDGGESAATTLVDLSESNEPKKNEVGGDVESEPKAALGVPNYHKSTTPDLTQPEKVEAIAKELEDNAQTKEGQGHPRTTDANAAKLDNATPAPTSEHKTLPPPLDVAV